MHAQTLSEKVWERHVVHRADDEPDLLYIDLHLVHEVTSPQAFEGLRLNRRTVRRPDLTLATMDHNVPTTDLDRPIADPVSARQMDVLRANCEEFGITSLRAGPCRPGNRARHRARAGAHAAGHDCRVRRQPHVDARCVRRTRVRHRHERGRARARDPDAPPAPAGHDVGHRRWRPDRGGYGQGHHPRHHRTHRHRRRHRSRRRVPGLRDPRPVDGGSHDGVQHVDRGRRDAQGWSRQTTRRSPTSRAGPTRRRVPHGSAALDDWRGLATDDGATFDREVAIDATELRPHVSWGTNPSQVVAIDGAVPDPTVLLRARRTRNGGTRPRLHGHPAGDRRSATSQSTRCSSDRARTRASRTCGPQPRWSRAATCKPASGRWSSRGRAR